MAAPHRFVIASVAVVAVLLAGAPGHAQVEMSATKPSAGARLAGVVTDSITGEPIEGVMVRLDSGAESLTDALGRFDFRGLPEGKRLVALLTSDCRVTWGEVTVLERFPREVEFRLPPAFGATAEARRREREERQRTGGRRLEAEEIDRINARSVLELVRRLDPGMVSGLPGEVGADPTIMSSRNSSLLPNAEPVVAIDGVRTPNPELVLSQMHPSEVQLLEILPGAAAGWEYGSAGASGIIKITLRRGRPTGAPQRREVAPCVVPSFPRR